MLCRAKASNVSHVGLDVATDSVLFSLTGGVSFCSGVDRARGSYGEPKVTPPSLVYTPSDLTSVAPTAETAGEHPTRLPVERSAQQFLSRRPVTGLPERRICLFPVVVVGVDVGVTGVAC
jgi:hypothetical protein